VPSNPEAVALMAADKSLSAISRRAARNEALVCKSLANICSGQWDPDEAEGDGTIPDDLYLEFCDLRNRLYYELRRR
jgi:hypothetical protein